MPIPKDFQPFLPGYRMPNGSRLQDLQDAISSVYDNLTALAGGGQTGAPLLNAALNSIATVATAGDSAILPIAVAGYSITVANAGANSMNIFPAVGDSIGAGGANAAYALAAGKSAIFFCTLGTNGAIPGKWRVLLSA